MVNSIIGVVIAGLLALVIPLVVTFLMFEHEYIFVHSVQFGILFASVVAVFNQHVWLNVTIISIIIFSMAVLPGIDFGNSDSVRCVSWGSSRPSDHCECTEQDEHKYSTHMSE